jgi:hypothetical protein
LKLMSSVVRSRFARIAMDIRKVNLTLLMQFPRVFIQYRKPLFLTHIHRTEDILHISGNFGLEIRFTEEMDDLVDSVSFGLDPGFGVP